MSKASEEIFQHKTDFKEIIFRVLKYKYYFIASLFFALCMAFLVNKYSDRKYSNGTTLLIREEKSKSLMNSGRGMMSEFDLFGGIQNVENELSILRSFASIYEAVLELNLEITYMQEESLFPLKFLPFSSYTDLYDSSPIRIISDQTHVQPVNARFYVEAMNDSTFRIKTQSENVALYDYVTNSHAGFLDSLNFFGIFRFGEKVKSKYFDFIVHKNENFRLEQFKNKKFFFLFNDLFYLTVNYQANLSISTASQTSSVVVITLQGSHPKKITDFLNVLTKVYVEKNLEKKNKIAYNTVKFIDSRISDIADSLRFAENKLQFYRSSNQAMNLSFQGEQLYERVNSLENERAIILMKRQYFDYIKNYFNKNQDVSDLVVPSAMDVQDEVINNLINELLQINNQRMNYLQNNPKNLFIKDLEIQINNLKKTILENINYNYDRIEISLDDINSRMAKINSQISRLPKTEREVIGMERQTKLNDAIYTFLLQKRAEAQIARASNDADYEVVDEAYYFRSGIISPKTKMNYVIAAFLGLFLPFLIIIVRDFLNNKITDIKDIENLTNLPIIGQVLHNSSKVKAIITEYPKSPIADSFRSIRTNLNFFAQGRDKMTILITSSMSGEGKSFTSINLASVYALLGKKTILLGFDLRRPALYKEFQLKNDKGITSYLIHHAEIKDIIQPTQIENLDLIAAGPIPPNPVELMASDRNKQFFDEIKKLYDYVIIDSSPIGAVTDSFLLFKFADINIFTIRHNYSLKEAVKSNLKNIEIKKIPNVSIVVNDVKMNKNSYGYAYQSNYYESSEKKSLLRSAITKKVKRKS
jgi:capsular exopolysaccharide synthesis family protein